MENQNINKYLDVMNEIKWRLSVIMAFLSMTATTPYEPTTIESIYLQLRKVLELIAFSSLIANEKEYAAVYSNVSSAWNAEFLLKDVARVNPNFYPKPIKLVPSTKAGVRMDFQEVPEADCLTQADFIKLYKKCGALMHAGNPFGSRVDYTYYKTQIELWLTKIVNLLNSHQVRLVNDPNLYFVQMSAEHEKPTYDTFTLVVLPTEHEGVS